jgi:hypothetical protein
MFGAFDAPDNVGPTGPVRPTFVRIWLVAAVALVAGILIGFASGFTAGKRVNESGAPAGAARDSSEQPSASSPTFTEEAVGEPVRVEPPPVVPESAPSPAVSEPRGRVERGEPARRAEERVDAPAPARVERAPAARATPAPPVQRAPAVDQAASGQGSMEVVSRPSGAQVVLDGRTVGRTPLSIEVPDGAHDVRLDLPGFRRWETSVEVTAGQRTRVAASLEQ